MKVREFLHEKSILLGLERKPKPEVISDLCRLLVAQGYVQNGDEALKALMDREKLCSTGIGQGVAIPHGKTASATQLVAALGVSTQGIQFDALDGEPVHIIFLLIGPPDSAAQHLKALARISRLLKDKFFRQAIREAKTVEDVVRIIQNEDQQY